MHDEFAAGASAARYKLAAFLSCHDIHVQLTRWNRPPTDEDFLDAIRTAIRAAVQGANGPKRKQVRRAV